MRIIGNMSAFFLFNLAFLMIFFILLGRFPEKELSLLWNAIVTGKSAEDVKPAAEAKSEETPSETKPAAPGAGKGLDAAPSITDKLNRIAAEDQELARQRTALESMRKLVEISSNEAKRDRNAVAGLLDELKKGVEDKKADLEKKGQQEVVELIDVMKPNMVKNFLLDLPSDDMAITYIKQMDPVIAAKAFKEFQQPEDIRKLNRWLLLLGQGQPDAKKADELLGRVPTQK